MIQAVITRLIAVKKISAAFSLALLLACATTTFEDKLSVVRSGLEYRISEFSSYVNTDYPPVKAGNALLAAGVHYKKAERCECDEEIQETENWLKEYDKRLREWKNK